MTSFEHLFVLVSIIIGLALADVLTSVHKLVMARRRVRFHWLPLTWAFLLFVAATQYWWAFFRTGQAEVWTQFFAFLFVLMELVTLYLIASSALPDVEAGRERIDLKAHYFETKWWFFGLIAVYVALLVADRVLRGRDLLDPIHAYHLAGLVLVLTLMFSRSTLVHGLFTGATAVVFFTFVVQHTLRIM